jgi:hypothetical protein
MTPFSALYAYCEHLLFKAVKTSERFLPVSDIINVLALETRVAMSS